MRSNTHTQFVFFSFNFVDCEKHKFFFTFCFLLKLYALATVDVCDVKTHSTSIQHKLILDRSWQTKGKCCESIAAPQLAAAATAPQHFFVWEMRCTFCLCALMREIIIYLLKVCVVLLFVRLLSFTTKVVVYDTPECTLPHTNKAHFLLFLLWFTRLPYDDNFAS